MQKATATAIALVLGLMAAAPTLAQAPAAPAAPSQAIAPTKNPAAAPAGVYNLDTNHSSVFARVGHGNGASFSTMRFGVTKAVLTWDPVNAAAIKIDVTVDTKPHVDPIVYRVGPDAPQMLNVAMFPTATFVSTAVKKTGAATADVEGNLTLLGVTKPAVIKAELVGAGRTAQGKPVIGFTGTMVIKRADFGTPFLPNAIGNDVTVLLDGEFLGG